MKREDAKAVLAEHLSTYRSKPHRVLTKMIGQVDAYEVPASDGVTHQIEIQVLWDDKPGGDIRVIGSIDDGGWRAFAPLSDDFIVSPEGASVED